MKKRMRLGLFGVLVFALGFVAVFFGVQFVTRTGVFRVPGVVYYDDSLTEEELAVLNDIFTDEVELDRDVYISAQNYLEKPTLEPGEFLWDIYVVVTDFYNVDLTNVEVERAEELFVNCECGYELARLEDLDFSRKLLSINDKYYLDDFNAGAVFRVIKLDSEKYQAEVAPLLGEVLVRDFPEENTVLTLAQTGVTALSRGMNAKLYQVGDAEYFVAGVGEFLSQFDLTHTSNEASFSDFATGSNICSDKRFIDTLTGIGLDIVELTGNHNLDCGDEAALETLDIYEERGIRTVGGGKTADEAAVPLEINEKGNNVTMLAYNLSTGGATYDATPGANQYYEEVAAEQIASAKARGDVVIVDIQYYECSMYVSTTEDTTCDYADSAAGDQVGFFRHLIELGADVVVGTSAHQPQTYELYGDGVIYYGLGNLFFDQMWWPGTTRSLVLVHHIYNGKILQTEIVPTVYDSDLQTRIMDAEMAQWFLNRLISVRP